MSSVATTPADYKTRIACATVASVLHGLSAEIAADPFLTAQEKYNLGLAVGLRFSELNYAVNPNPKPRW